LHGLRPIRELGDDFAIVPLPGHSIGHCGVVVRSGCGWLLHAGDAYMQRAELQAAPAGPARTGLFQPVMQADGRARLDSLAQPSGLARNHSNAIKIFSAHDKVEFEALCGLTGGQAEF
jgi:glyoxylase-like metal-dependent hydrolase (beta-lactamase superfamily II)